MGNSKAIQALKLGFSYQDNVLNNLHKLEENYSLSSKFIDDLRFSIENFEKAESIDPAVVLNDGRNVFIGKAISVGLMGCIRLTNKEE